MADSSNVVKSLLLFLALAVSCSQSHIIGGSINTLVGTGNPTGSIGSIGTFGVPSWLKHVVYAHRRRAPSAQTTESPDVLLTSPQEEPEEVRRHANSASDETHPFLRTRREATGGSCQLPANLPQQVQELNSVLNSTQFLGLDLQSSQTAPNLPNDQPTQCPNETGSWWPSSHPDRWNLRSTCPWIYRNKFMGDNTFPRYVQETECLCEDCVSATGSSCRDIKWQITVFEKTGCQDGLAVMVRKRKTVNVGCYCAKGQPQHGSQQQVTETMGTTQSIFPQ